MQIAWKWLFRAILALVFFLTVRAGAFLYDYSSFEAIGPAQKTTWTVEARDKDFFGLSCSYSYYLNGRKYSATFQFDKPQFSNKFVAEKHLSEAKTANWTVYVNKLQPKESRLQHNFPFKELAHLALALLAFVYFRWVQAHLPSPFPNPLSR